MGLDATASGIQIMGALSGCHNTARAVNLIDTGIRQDFYGTVADSMNQLPGINVLRSAIKKPVMTVFYGSTAQPKQLLGEGPELTAFYKALEEKATGAYELMGLFQSHWNPNAEYHQWTLPDGHIARVPVTQTVDKSIEIDELSHMRFTYRTKIVCPKIKSRSLAANIVHSIDGWIVRMMVHQANKNGYWLAPIHDCFFASPNNMNDVRQNYLTLLAWIADSNLVQSILWEISGRDPWYVKHSNDLSKSILLAEYALS
jgi:DNA-directed RNA polymerase